MKLVFPELRGGQVQGLNDAGVENFQGAIDAYLARECGQNTGDARRDGEAVARLEFSRLEIPSVTVPAFAEIRTVLEASLDRWKGKPKEEEFFETALKVASQDSISVLKISDYGTTGLSGDDIDENGRWVALVKSQGLSNKDGTAGGSFGIGKSSPFAASRFRTVFYGTRTASDSLALQGVCRLVTHKNPAGKLTQGTGFIGNYDPTGGEDGGPLFGAVRVPSAIPATFQRTEPGTDIWVVGYRSGDDWEAELTRSILTNFWPALHRGFLSFKVGDQVIDGQNCLELMSRYIEVEDFAAHHYYRAVLNQPAKKKLKHTGECELYLSTSSADLPKKVCMVRGNGMRIFDYSPRACRVPFSGLFICGDPAGNRLLREMEPPKHDAWDPKRVDDSSGKQALDEIKAWIRDEVKKLNPFFSGKSFNEPELAKYLPESTPEDAIELTGGADAGSGETLESVPRAGTVKAKPVRAAPVDTSPGDEVGNAGGIGAGGKERGGGVGGDGGPPNEGVSGGIRPKSTSRSVLHVRSYCLGTPGEYELVIRSAVDFAGGLAIRTVGEDASREGTPVLSATEVGAATSELKVVNGAIDGLTLKAGVPMRVRIQIIAAAPRALSADAIS